MVELAEAHRYITPPIDEEVERIATEYLQSGGGFLSRKRADASGDPLLGGSRKLDSSPSTDFATTTEEASPQERDTDISANEPPPATVQGGFLARLKTMFRSQR